MSAVNSSGPPDAGPVPAGNGTQRAPRGGAAGRRRTGARPQVKAEGIPGAVAPQPRLAPFGVAEATAIHGEIWPLHAGMWLQPELRPALPASSDLRIERRHKVPLPGFVKLDICPAPHLNALESFDFIRTRVEPRVPNSDLAPLGWNPRIACAGAPERRSCNARRVAPDTEEVRDQPGKERCE